VQNSREKKLEKDTGIPNTYKKATKISDLETTTRYIFGERQKIQ
jgi:hypothetical protein